MAETGFFDAYRDHVIRTLEALDMDAIHRVTEAMLAAYRDDRSFFIFGNGGSGATASHIAGDFVKGVSYGLTHRFRFTCLNDNNASMMAIANDIGYDDIFVEPLRNFMRPGDVVIGLSGSGHSENVVRALDFAGAEGGVTMAFCGYDGGKIRSMADHVVHADIHDMEVSEDIHLIAFHMIKQSIIATLKGDDTSMGAKYDARV